MVFPEFNFKFTYTDIVIRYLFDTNKTMAEFINYIINNVYIDFDVRNDLIIEIIEAGQNTNQYESEMAPALLPSSIAFKNYYANKNMNELAFYIRVKTRNNNVIRQVQQMRRENRMNQQNHHNQQNANNSQINLQTLS
jgi:hypothetical protein